MEKIVRHLKNSRRILVTTHINPDGDAIGSLIAMGLSIRLLNKKATLYNESPIPAVYRFLPYIGHIEGIIPGPEEYDTVVILDCGDLHRIGSASEQFERLERRPMMINIDHHATNSGFGDLMFIDPSACATAEIVFRMIKLMEVPIIPAIATAIYTGIFTDTGSFRFSNTNKAAFSICDEMVSLGVDPYTVAKHVYGTYSLGRIKLLNLALETIEISENGKLSLMTLTRDMFDETGTRPEDVDGIIHYARFIEDVQVAVLIQEYNNSGGNGDLPKCHVSLRSDGSVDVAAIASGYGGGGHQTAAGFNIEGKLSDLRNGMLQLAEVI